MVSRDSSMKPTRDLFLESTKVLTVPLNSSALTLTVTTTEIVLFFPNYCISLSEKRVDIIGESELVGKIALYVISQG